MTQKSTTAPNRWPLLDFLRATAALLVLFGHTRNWFFLNIGAVEQPSLFLKLFYFITRLEHEAVVIFFVLSGFLIGGSLFNSMQRGNFDLIRYLVARFVRIYIVYAPALVITAGVFWLGTILLSDPGQEHIRPLFSEQQMDLGGLHGAICHVVGLQGFSCTVWDQNPPLWSLGYEWALYLFAPAVIKPLTSKASLGLRMIAILYVLAVAVTICNHPNVGAFWFFAWFLGAGASRLLRAKLVPLSVGLLGAGLIIAGMAVARLSEHPELWPLTRQFFGELDTDIVISLGTALAIACRPVITFSIAPRLFAWMAGFSYTLYAIHLPLVFLIIAIFQSIGFPRDKILAGPVAFMEFCITVVVCLLVAFLVSLVTERKTNQARAALLRALFAARDDWNKPPSCPEAGRPMRFPDHGRAPPRSRVKAPRQSRLS